MNNLTETYIYTAKDIAKDIKETDTESNEKFSKILCNLDTIKEFYELMHKFDESNNESIQILTLVTDTRNEVLQMKIFNNGYQKALKDMKEGKVK